MPTQLFPSLPFSTSEIATVDTDYIGYWQQRQLKAKDKGSDLALCSPRSP